MRKKFERKKIYINELTFNLRTFTLPSLGRVITVNNPECLEHVLKGKFGKLCHDLIGSY